jgi:hypothetical protein
MKTQASGFVQIRNGASPQIRFHECARDRLRHGDQAPCRFRRPDRNRRSTLRALHVDLRPRQAEEAARLRLNIMEIIKTTNVADDVKQVAMLAGGGIGLMFNCT